jgi:hypothetical protein
MDAVEALVNLEGCASTLMRLADTAVALHQDCRLAEALCLIARSIGQNRETLRWHLQLANALDRDRPAAPVIPLRLVETDRVEQ